MLLAAGIISLGFKACAKKPYQGSAYRCIRKPYIRPILILLEFNAVVSVIRGGPNISRNIL